MADKNTKYLGQGEVSRKKDLSLMDLWALTGKSKIARAKLEAEVQKRKKNK